MREHGTATGFGASACDDKGLPAIEGVKANALLAQKRVASIDKLIVARAFRLRQSHFELYDFMR